MKEAVHERVSVLNIFVFPTISPTCFTHHSHLNNPRQQFYTLLIKKKWKWFRIRQKKSEDDNEELVIGSRGCQSRLCAFFFPLVVILTGLAAPPWREQDAASAEASILGISFVGSQSLIPNVNSRSMILRRRRCLLKFLNKNQEIRNILGNLTSIICTERCTYSLNSCPTLSIRHARLMEWGKGLSNTGIGDVRDLGPQHTSKPGFTPLPSSATAGITLELTRVLPSPEKAREREKKENKKKGR